MDINVNNPAPSAAEIEAVRQSCKKHISVYQVSYILCISIPFIFSFYYLLGGSEFSKDQFLMIELVVLLGCVFGSLDLMTAAENMEKKARKYDNTDFHDCLKIKEWLALPEIQSYRDQVIAQHRKFINAEVRMMHKFYHSHQQAIKDAAAQEACREVYGIVEGTI